MGILQRCKCLIMRVSLRSAVRLFPTRAVPGLPASPTLPSYPTMPILLILLPELHQEAPLPVVVWRSSHVLFHKLDVICLVTC